MVKSIFLLSAKDNRCLHATADWVRHAEQSDMFCHVCRRVSEAHFPNPIDIEIQAEKAPQTLGPVYTVSGRRYAPTIIRADLLDRLSPALSEHSLGHVSLGGKPLSQFRTIYFDSRSWIDTLPDDLSTVHGPCTGCSRPLVSGQRWPFKFFRDAIGSSMVFATRGGAGIWITDEVSLRFKVRDIPGISQIRFKVI
jgi:hypothetical protein